MAIRDKENTYTTTIAHVIIEYTICNETTNPYLEVGTPDGSYEWNYSGAFNVINNKTDDIAAAINTYLETCTYVNGVCNVPFTFHSDTTGLIQYSDITVSLSTNIDIKTINDTMDLINFYSKWDYNLPRFVEYLEFIPKSPSAKNVSAYGQSNAIPILNITTYNYGGRNMNLSYYLNETHECVNLTASNNQNKSPGILLEYPFLCYQETANVSTDCGGLSTGVYSFENGTEPVHSAHAGWMYINYTKPLNATSNSVWQVKGGNIATTNVSLDDCWDAYPSKVLLRAESYIGGSWSGHAFQCYNSTNWISLSQQSSNLGGGCGTKPTNISLLYDGDWDTRVSFCNGEWMMRSYDSASIAYIYEEAMIWGSNINTTQLIPVWADFRTDLEYLNNSKLWLWADYSCNYTTWGLYNPDLYLRGCCEGCVCSEELQ